ncbi:MAG: hypothetical protein AB7U20_08850, partial [Planctomycetaceae bacterium]
MLQLLIPQPALRELFIVRARARVRRLHRSLSSPHRVLLSTIAIVLPLVWIGNFAASMLLREHFSPEAFRQGVLLTGVGYFLWYLLKASLYRPAAAIEWTSAEASFLCGGPFLRSDLIRYRLAVIFSATLLKAVFSSVMFLPELTVWWAGFLGILLGLAFLDLARMSVETVLCELPNRAYRAVRFAVLGSAGVSGTVAAIAALSSDAVATSPFPAAVALPLEFVRQLASLRESAPGLILSALLLPFVEVITAAHISWQLPVWIATGAGITLALIPIVIRLDALFAHRAAETVRRSYAGIAAEPRARVRKSDARTGLPSVVRLCGARPIAWRQWLGVRKYQTGLLIALSVPAALSCLPLIQSGEAIETILNV